MKRSLSRKNMGRKSFCGSIGRPVVAGFGATESWQQNGIWKGFRGVSDFYLHEVPHEKLPGARSDDHEREIKGSAFLSFIDELEKKADVTCAYFYHSGRHISDELIKELHRRGIWTIVMSLDDNHQFSYPKCRKTGESHQLRVARQVDLYWTTWKAGTELVGRNGGNPWYGGMAADQEFYCPLGLERDMDVVFVGANYGIRKTLVEKLRGYGVHVHGFGVGWPNGPVSPEEMVRLYSRAKIVLGTGVVGYMSGVKHLKGRDFEVPMCGALYLTSYNPELCDFFDIGREILCYGSIEEGAELIRWFLRNPEESEKIRASARNRSIRDHTWEKRLKNLFDLLPHSEG
ncbi:MAG: glycosyltransferase family 1 protein [Nitrospirae bacterium]|nr:glycosyltransferase family 1 protein [Nitrospirota bacterium]